ncbi:MAG TPA: preprotein translocase subunit SecG [Steroidobacteraceae bacterium]|jgi:preprotein translocase subunit SecG
MNWLHTATIVIHVLLGVGIVGLVLLQRGRGADAGAGFGAGASGTVFGARGSASFLSRSTATLAGLFIVTSLILAYVGSRRSEAPTSVIDRVQQTQPAPASGEAALPSVPTAADSTTQQPVETAPAPATPPPEL